MAEAGKRRVRPAIIFLWIVAALIILAVIGWAVVRTMSPQLMRYAFVPDVSWAESPQAAQPDYAAMAGWIAHPQQQASLVRETPPGISATDTAAVDVFFIAPTTYLSKAQWNDPLDDEPTNARTAEMVRHVASAFNGVGAIYAPRYRQATLGAFLTDRPEAAQAFDLAYADVLAAFDSFTTSQPLDRPFINASHSQGSRHALNLLKDRVDGTSLAARMVGAWVVGWPVSIAHDLGALDIPACRMPDDAGCILSWQTFGQPADPADLMRSYAALTALDGQSPGGTDMLCVNPVTGRQDARPSEPAEHGGALAFVSPGTPLPALLPLELAAQCSANGILEVAPVPGDPFETFQLPGNNLHTYDFTLFWADVRDDVARRLNAYLAR